LDAARTLLALEDVSSDQGLVLSKDQKDDLFQRLRKTAEQLPELAKACYTVLYEPVGAQGETRIHPIGATIKTQPTVHSAVVETLRSEDRLLAALDPALLIQFEPYRLWPVDTDTITLRNLRDYFDRYPHLPMLESTDVLKNAVIRGVQNGIFEATVKTDDDFTQVWRRTNAPSVNDLFFADHYLLARTGHVPHPREPEKPETASVEPPAGAQDTRAGTNGSPTPSATRASKTGVRKLSLNFEDLPMSQIADLVNVVGALEDAGGEVSIRVNLTAANPDGLDETMVEMNVREVLSQSGLQPDWEES